MNNVWKCMKRTMIIKELRKELTFMCSVYIFFIRSLVDEISIRAFYILLHFCPSDLKNLWSIMTLIKVNNARGGR